MNRCILFHLSVAALCTYSSLLLLFMLRRQWTFDWGIVLDKKRDAHGSLISIILRFYSMLPHTGQHWTYTVIYLHAYSSSLLPVTRCGAFCCGGLLKLVMAAGLESSTQTQRLTLVVVLREHLLQVPPGLWKRETFYGISAIRLAEITCRHNV